MILKKVNKFSKKNKWLIFFIILGILYFSLMIRYYLTDYYVPDFRLYYSFALENSKARDGFSSLFILIASLAARRPKQVILTCLLLLSLSLINFSIFAYKMIGDNKKKLLLSILGIYSCSVWYYFYGKLFYDFPFSAYSFSVCLLLMTKILEQKDKKIKYWLLLCIMFGFTLSWKPYNIFSVAGLGLLMIGKKETRNLLVEVVKKIKYLIFSIALFIFGYVLGNFNLLFAPRETINGIRAYSASYDIWSFLYTKNRIIWDHINDLSFNYSTMCLISAIIILFILPTVLKKKNYLGISIFMSTCFLIFIKNFSPGFAWHGFNFGLFIITFLVFVLSDTTKYENLGNKIIFVAILFQMSTCYFFYIPLQHKWYTITEDSIKAIEKNEAQIYRDVKYLVTKYKDYNYEIDLLIKRMKPIPIGEDQRESFSLLHTNFVSYNYTFPDPLEATNYEGWRELKNEGNTRSDLSSKMIVWIVPKNMQKISDVVDMNLYSDKILLDKIYKDEYNIYLYMI